MNLLDLFPLWAKLAILAALASFVAAAGTWFIHHERDIGRAEVRAGWDADRVQWQAALAKQKLEAAQILAVETARASEAERRLGEFLINQEKRDANHEAVVTDLQRRLAGVRLRDPNATPARCGPSGGGAQGGTAAAAADRAADAAGETGLLSMQFSDLLRAKLRRADDINNAYASCRATAVNDRAQQAVKP